MAFAADPRFSDITPIPLQDGPNPIVPIAYAPECTHPLSLKTPICSRVDVDAMDYFRALSQRNEKSERALDLTTAIIKMNPAHYTIWTYRQDIIRTLSKPLKDELVFIEEICIENKKNYQLWHHRQVVVEMLGDASNELEFVKRMLKLDAKNYHAWTYRQWVIRHFNLWDGELDYVDELLHEDIRNNSAWNQRYFVNVSVHGNPPLPDDVLRREIEYTKAKIKMAPNNESPWNYLRGIVGDGHLHNHPDIEEMCQTLLNGGVTSPHMYNMLADIYALRMENDKARNLFELLATKFDVIRKKYWQYRIEGLQ